LARLIHFLECGARETSRVAVSLDAETGALLEGSQEADFGSALATLGKSTADVLQARKDAERERARSAAS